MLPRTGPRRLVTRRHCGGRAGHGLLTPIGVDTAYATHVLPPLILVRIGFALTLAPCFATATFSVPARDGDVASAIANTSQQVGGSIGTALLSALAASAATDFPTIAGPAPRWCARTPSTLRHRALVGRGVFTADALVRGSLLRSDVRPEMTHGGGPEPAPGAHVRGASTGGLDRQALRSRRIRGGPAVARSAQGMIAQGAPSLR